MPVEETGNTEENVAVEQTGISEGVKPAAVKKSKLPLIAIIVLSMAVVGLGAFVTFDKLTTNYSCVSNDDDKLKDDSITFFDTCDETIKEPSGTRGYDVEYDNETRTLYDNSLERAVIDQLYSSRITHFYCRLDKNYLSDVLSPNYSSDGLSKRNLVLQAISMQRIDYYMFSPDDPTVKISNLNASVKKLFEVSNPITRQDIAASLDGSRIGNFFVENMTDSTIDIRTGAYGCTGTFENLFTKIVRVEWSYGGESAFYVDVKMGFGKNYDIYEDFIGDGPGKMNYYKDINMTDFAVVGEYGEDVDLGKLDTYRHEFRVVDRAWRFMGAEKL